MNWPSNELFEPEIFPPDGKGPGFVSRPQLFLFALIVTFISMFLSVKEWRNGNQSAGFFNG